MNALLAALALACALALSTTDAAAKARSTSSGHSSKATHAKSGSSGPRATHVSSARKAKRTSTLENSGPRRASGVKRDKNGKIARSQKAKSEFRKRYPCPATGKSTGACPGYVIDHIKPLKRGGPDTPSNMQWQTKAAAKAKDKTE